jgi:hypothetical protein
MLVISKPSLFEPNTVDLGKQSNSSPFLSSPVFASYSSPFSYPSQLRNSDFSMFPKTIIPSSNSSFFPFSPSSSYCSNNFSSLHSSSPIYQSSVFSSKFSSSKASIHPKCLFKSSEHSFSHSSTSISNNVFISPSIVYSTKPKESGLLLKEIGYKNPSISNSETINFDQQDTFNSSDEHCEPVVLSFLLYIFFFFLLFIYN